MKKANRGSPLMMLPRSSGATVGTGKMLVGAEGLEPPTYAL